MSAISTVKRASQCELFTVVLAVKLFKVSFSVCFLLLYVTIETRRPKDIVKKLFSCYC